MTLLEVGRFIADIGYLGGVALAAVLSRPLLAALRDLATVGRLLVTSRSEEARQASAERAELLRLVGEVHGIVVSGGRRE